MQYSNLINIMLAATKKAEPRILRDFHELRFLQNSQRSIQSFVQASISKAEEAIIAALKKARPEFGIISTTQGVIQKPDVAFIKEYGLSPALKYWLVNVLDGAENFMRAIPHFAMSIALKQVNSSTDEEIICGLINAPALGEVYFAEKGNGAWCEFSNEDKAGLSETRLRISEKPTSSPVTLVYGIALDESHIKSSIRMIGSPAISLAYLAAGRADKCLMTQNAADLAGMIIAKEAGAVMKSENLNGASVLYFMRP